MELMRQWLSISVRRCRPGKSVQMTEQEVRGLCLKSREIFLQQPILLELEAPLSICGEYQLDDVPFQPKINLDLSGDIHGQYTDLLRLFEYGGYPPTNYLFLGDYVDRGKQSLETICLLLCYKIKYPENFFLLRGNHECASINRIYGWCCVSLSFSFNEADDRFSFQDFSTNANDDTTSSYGKPSQTASTVCQSLPLLTRRSSAVTAVSALTCRIWNRSNGLFVRQTFRTRAYCAISCGAIRIRMSRFV